MNIDKVYVAFCTYWNGDLCWLTWLLHQTVRVLYAHSTNFQRTFRTQPILEVFWFLPDNMMICKLSDMTIWWQTMFPIKQFWQDLYRKWMQSDFVFLSKLLEKLNTGTWGLDNIKLGTVHQQMWLEINVALCSYVQQSLSNACFIDGVPWDTIGGKTQF